MQQQKFNVFTEFLSTSTERPFDPSGSRESCWAEEKLSAPSREAEEVEEHSPIFARTLGSTAAQRSSQNPKGIFLPKGEKRCLTAAAGHRACYLQVLLAATHAVAIPQWGLKQGKRHQADASKLPSKWSSNKGKGGKEVFHLHSAERKNYYVSLRREVISMLIITQGNLTLPDLPTKRTQHVSLLELDCFVLIFNRSFEGRWFSEPFFFLKLFSGFFQSSFCSPLHWQPNIYCQRCSPYIKMEKQQSCVLILAFTKKDKE